MLQCREIAQNIEARTGFSILFEADDIENHSYILGLSTDAYTDYTKLLTYLQSVDEAFSSSNYSAAFWAAVAPQTNRLTLIFGTDIKQNGSVMTNVYGVTAYSSNSIKMNCDIVLKVCTPYMCDSGEAERVVHHEMFHYIENVLSLKNSSKYSDWTEWVSLNNPQGFEYNDQINIGQGETQKLKTSSLISWYAGYSASEDRAEVFSYMCMDTGLPSTTRIKAASYDPYLKKKASYLAAEVNSALGLSNTVWSAGATAMNEAALPTDGLQSATVIATGGIKLRESTIRNNVYVQNSGSDVEIPAGATVTIYRWSNEIVQIGYNGHVGYCDTEDLQRINSNPLLLSSSFHASLICGAVIHHYNKKRKLVA